MFDFLSKDHLEMLAAVRKVAQREIGLYQNEKCYGTVPRELFNKLAEAGLAGLPVPEEYGGINAGAVLTALIMEELAREDLGVAVFVSVHAMISGLICRFGSQDQKSRLLPLLSSGKMLGAFALTEPRAGSDAAGLKTSFKKAEGGYILNGEKCYITSAGWADLYIVFARKEQSTGSKDISAFIVETDPGKQKAGLEISPPEKKMGAELSPIASMSFKELFVPESGLLGQEGRGYQVALGGLAGGRINIAACANGLSHAAIRLALEHMKEREQFGAKLIEFQGLQFMLADMHIALEGARALTLHAAKTLEAGEDSGKNKLSPSVAKCAATDAAMKITTDAVQLLGGAGYIREYKVERLMRDAKMLQIVEGTNQIQRMIIGKGITDLY